MADNNRCHGRCHVSENREYRLANGGLIPFAKSNPLICCMIRNMFLLNYVFASQSSCLTKNVLLSRKIH